MCGCDRRWRPPTKVDFEAVLGNDTWNHYWSLYEAVIAELKECQVVADAMKSRIIESLRRPEPE
jgi:hypothetical protein